VTGATATPSATDGTRAAMGASKAPPFPRGGGSALLGKKRCAARGAIHRTRIRPGAEHCLHVLRALVTEELVSFDSIPALFFEAAFSRWRGTGSGATGSPIWRSPYWIASCQTFE